jgi:hypothetical protein
LWGIGFDALKTALITFQASGVTPKTLAEWSGVGIGLGYQFGYLILPAVTPLVVWLVLFRDYVGAFAPAVRGRRSTPSS